MEAGLDLRRDRQAHTRGGEGHLRPKKEAEDTAAKLKLLLKGAEIPSSTHGGCKEESEEFNGPLSRTVKNKFALPVEMRGDPQAESGPCRVSEDDIDEPKLQSCKIFAGQRMSMEGYQMQQHLSLTPGSIGMAASRGTTG